MFEMHGGGSGDVTVPLPQNSSSADDASAVATNAARPDRVSRLAGAGCGRSAQRGTPRRPASRADARARRAGTVPAAGSVHAADVPGAIVAAFFYDTKVLLERYVPGRNMTPTMYRLRRRTCRCR